MKKKMISIGLAVLMTAGIISFGTRQAYADGYYGSTISAGFNASMAVKDDGSYWAWGSNALGHFGDENYKEKLSPGKMMDGVKSVSSSIGHSMAIKTDGSLWGWGRNDHGQLGVGTTKTHLTPVKVMDDVRSVSAGFAQTMAVTTDGTLWGWGWNDLKHLGLKVADHVSKPVKIMGDVKSVSTGYFYTAAVKTDGSLWYWGSEYKGDMGIDIAFTAKTFEAAVEPTKLMDDVESVSVGGNHIMAIKKDGTLWSWGSNSNGQLGIGHNSAKSGPVKVMGDVKAVSAGGLHTLIITNDGTLWSCGKNEYGQLGDNTFVDQLEPVKAADNVVEASAGDCYSLIVKADGTLWGSGYNDLGQLGNNSRENAGRFVKITDGIMLPSAAPEPTPTPKPEPADPSESENSASDWAKTAVGRLILKDLIPDELCEKYQEPITRAEYAVLMVTAYEYATGEKITTSTWHEISDIKNHRYEQALLQARAAGLMSGVSAKSMDPDGKLTREQAATMLVNLIQKVQQTGITDYQAVTLKFDDDKDISSWAYMSVYYAADNGIVSGTGSNNFSPKSDLTREMGMVMLYNIIDKYQW